MFQRTGVDDLTTREINSKEDLKTLLADAEEVVESLDGIERTRFRTRMAMKFWTIARKSRDTRIESFTDGAARKWAVDQFSHVDDRELTRALGDSEGEEELDDVALVAEPDPPEKTLDDVVGDDIRETVLWDIVDDLLNNLAGKQNDVAAFQDATVGAMCMYGPPGTGKTLSSQIVAWVLGEMGHDTVFYSAHGSDIVDSELGHSSKRMKKLLQHADRQDELAVVFCDEIEQLVTRDGHGGIARLATTILEFTGGNDAFESVVFLGATNRPEELDDAFVDRFTMVHFPEPDVDVKRCIFLHKFDEYNTFTLDDLDTIDPRLFEELSGRGLERAARRAFKIARGRANARPTELEPLQERWRGTETPPPVTLQHAQTALTRELEERVPEARDRPSVERATRLDGPE